MLLNLDDIKNVKEMSILDNYYKSFLSSAKLGFRNSYKNDHLEVAQWIYSLGGFNHHTNNERAFRWACEKGHLEVTQWIYSLGGFNHHTNNEYAFRGTCMNGHS